MAREYREKRGRRQWQSWLRVHLPSGFLAPLNQSFDPAPAGLPINVIDENVLPPVSSIHDVVNCALIF